VALCLLALIASSCATAEQPCENSCAQPGVERVCVGEMIATCRVFEDGCLHFGQAEACPSDTVCRSGADGPQASCAPKCEAPCVVSATSCDGDLVRTCRMDASGCPAFDEGEPCPAGQRCDAGECVDETIPCENECAVTGQATCVDNAVRTCGSHDEDRCLDLGPSVACQSDETCIDGECEPMCTDACSVVGERECVAASGERAWVECVDVDGCLELGAVQMCETNERCDNGRCVPTADPCSDECPAAGARCVDGAVVVCGQHDADTCLEDAAPMPCEPVFETCVEGSCEPRAAPSVVIQELLYDPDGSDVAPGTGLFVELAGTAGAQLDGLRLVGVNGSDGGDYNIIDLSGTLPADGVYLIAHPNGSRSDQDAADAIQLRFGTDVIDALGYGGEAPNLHGEGTVAPDAAGDDVALTRDASSSDTGDNATDFTLSTPTPGTL